jgi:hypothetical protein
MVVEANWKLKERFIKEPRSTEGIYMGPFVYAAAAVF